MITSSQLVDKGGGAIESTSSQHSFAHALKNGGSSTNVNKQELTNYFNVINISHTIEISSIDGVPAYDWTTS